MKKCQFFLILFICFVMPFNAKSLSKTQTKFICGYKGVIEYINSLIDRDRQFILHQLEKLRTNKTITETTRMDLTVTLMMYRLLPINEDKKTKCRFFSYLCIKNNPTKPINTIYALATKYLQTNLNRPDMCHIYSSGREKTYPLLGEECKMAIEKRVRAISVPLAIAQAGLESAWGTSYFVKNGYNFFGIQTTFPSARQTRNNNQCTVARRSARRCVYKFNSVETSVFIYTQLLNTTSPYISLREHRYQSELAGNEPCDVSLKMAVGLRRYAEDPNYVKKVQNTIKKVCEIIDNC